ncbi:hypothetical protein EG327_004588 [Venturia inaequalis]|uniref:Uncharacterized protein n=1 Tax=Venturia inaequalis TaxID=5025 RepID=A0A8H3Z9Y1_VENIN|nr:hypothetical protein EG327_004588 [Venturia inaequalis]
MEFAGAAFSISPLLTTCSKISTVLLNVGRKFKRAPLMMTSIGTECNLIHVALSQVRSFDWSSMTGDTDDRMERTMRAIESIILGCQLTLSVIEEYAIELQDYVEGSPLSPTEQMGIMARVRVLWKEEEMRELLLQLRGYQSGLMGLIRAAHDSDFGDSQDDFAASNFAALLQRSRLTADFHDGAAHTTSSRKPATEAARRKRPVFLTLQPEESNYTAVEGRDVHTKRKKDQLRRSSPTVGQHFKFVPGEPPLSGLPPPPPSKDDHTTKTPGEEMCELHEEQTPSPNVPLEPLSAPPIAPLPQPPSRSPSRSRSPFEAPKIPARAPSRTTGVGSRQGYIDRPSVSAPILQHDILLEENIEQQRDPQRDEAVVPQEEPTFVQETSEAENGQSHPATPPADESSISHPPHSSILGPRKHISSSSMRSLIIGLADTARLRKDANAEALRNQPSVERSYTSPEVDKTVPALPMTEVSGFVRGNAFGQQSHMSPPPRTSSIEGLSERHRKQSVTDLRKDNQIYALPLRADRDMGRSTSDARRLQHLRFPAPQRLDDVNRLSPPLSATASTPSISFESPLSQNATSANSDSWPLTPEGGHTSEYNYSRNYTSQHMKQYIQPGGDHSRNTSSERSLPPSASTGQTLSPVQPRRTSRSNPSYSLTPRTGRSRNNTLMTINSEAGPGETVDDGMSTAGSMAPSVMSAQWFRTPQERLGLGTKVSRAEALPWEDLDVLYEGAGPPMPPKSKTTPVKVSRMGNGVANMFSVFPPRAPSRMLEKDERLNDSPPRSPLLTQSFLSDVETTLPADRPTQVHIIDDPPQTSTSMKSREGASTPDWLRTRSIPSIKEQKEEKKKKKKENSRFPTLGDMVKEYKAMTAIRYTSTYAEAAEEQRIEKEIREARRPGTSSTTSTRLGPTTSLDMRTSSSSPTALTSNSHRTKSLRTIPFNLRSRPSIDSFSSHAGTIHEYGSDGRYLDATETAAARANADKKRRKERKMSSAFPTVKEIWTEYKKGADSWYTGAYHEEEMRNVATPGSHFS